MNKTTSMLVTTACVGAVMGTAAYMMNGGSMRGKTRKLKKSTGKALRQVGDFIGNVSYMIK